MRIGIDARMCGKGFGLARYIEQFIIHLATSGITDTIIFFVKEKGQLDTIDLSPLTHKIIVADIPWYSVKEQLCFGRMIKKAKLDVMHFPHWNIPLLYCGNFVVTIHDLTMYHFPRPAATTLGPLIFWIKDQVHRLVVKKAVKQSAHIFATTEFTKQDLHKTLSVPLDKMTVTYQALYTDAVHPSQERIEQIKKKYGITHPFALYVGAAYPHKNIERLIDAWRSREGESLSYQLILAGKPNYFYERLVQQTEIEDDPMIRYIGFVPDDELAVLYKEATVFLYPSLYEGFGYPPLEALQQGTPVIASHASCLPEVLGQAAYYIDPENTVQLAAAITNIIEDPSMQSEILSHAKETLGRFSWKRMVEQTVRGYRGGSMKHISHST